MSGIGEVGVLTVVGKSALQRRVTERLPAEVEVDVHGDTNFYTGFSANISEGGVFIATYRPQAIGDRLRVRLRLPNREGLVEATVEVRWLRGNDRDFDSKPGFGAAFVELSPDARSAIEDFVALREPLFFEE